METIEQTEIEIETDDTSTEVDTGEVNLSDMTPEERAEYLDEQSKEKEEKEKESNPETKPDSKPVPKTEVKKPDAIQTKEEPKNIPEKVLVKIDGEEKEVTLEDLKRDYQKFQSANQRYEEAKHLRKQSEKLIEIMKTNPFDVLEKMGLDVEALAEERLLRKIQFEQMTDEQKEAYLAKEKLKSYEQMEQERKAQEEFHRLEQVKQHYKANFEREIIEAIETNELPRDSQTASKIIGYMQKVIANKLPLTVQDIIPLVKDDLKREEENFLNKYKQRDLDSLLASLGEDTVKAIQRKSIEKLKNPFPQVTSKPGVRSNGSSGKQKMSYEDYSKNLEQLMYD